MKRGYVFRPIGRTEGPGGCGGRLYDLRIQHSLSREGLALQIKCSATAIYKWERNLVPPGYWNLLEIAKFFNVTLDWLCGHQLKENGNEMHSA